jgi:thiamine biosynthesis lipoprotein
VPRQSNRRDFLRGLSAAHALGDAIQDALPGDWMAATADSYLLRVGRRAMACQFEISLNVGQYPEGLEVAMEVLDLVDRLESQLSYFRPESRISQINREAAFRPVTIEPELMQLLLEAAVLSRETEGAYDITSAPLWETWGFARRSGAIPDPRQLAEALELVGSRYLELDAQASTVRLQKPGMRLNLGSLGKGYTLDRCAEAFLNAGIKHFLIHAGGSSVIGRGSRGLAYAAAERGPGWAVGLPSPLKADRRLGWLRLRDRALGTSGSQAQSFWHQGKRYGHILDPRTGQPADRLLSATVVAPTAMLSDALSTAFYVMGPEAARAYCQQHPDCGAVLFLRARRAGGMEIRTAGLQAQDLLLGE